MRSKRIFSFSRVSTILVVIMSASLVGQVLVAVEGGGPLASPPESPVIQAHSIDSALQSLSQKGQELLERERVVQKREGEVDLRIADLEKKIEELKIARQELSAAIGTAKQSSQEDVQYLVDLYEKMKPKAASEVFQLMDIGLASGLLSRMETDRSAQILALLPAEKSYAISARIAGRNVQFSESAR